MIEKTITRWAEYLQSARTRWKWVGRGLTIAASIYIIVLLVYSGFQIAEINWRLYWQAALISLGLYFISLVIQFFAWVRMLSFHNKASWQDVVIYTRVILLRRLPGGVWHWVGRTAMYAESTPIPSRVIMVASFVEWTMLILVAGGIAISGFDFISVYLRLPAAVVLLVLAGMLGFSWQPAGRNLLWRSIETIVWVMIYACAWLLGGMIFYTFFLATGGEGLSWLRAWWVWAISGGSSMLLFIVPGGSGIREILLTWVLNPYLPPASVILIAILIRILFILGDVLWGYLGLLLSLRITRKITSNQQKTRD
jgi:glycosyltransferase 2 family protein